MGKIHRLYFTFALLLILFSCMQAAKCNPLVFSNLIFQETDFQPVFSVYQTTSFTWEKEQPKYSILPLVSIISYRTIHGRNWKFPATVPGHLAYSRFLASSKQTLTDLHKLSNRKSNGFYLYLLKKLLI